MASRAKDRYFFLKNLQAEPNLHNLARVEGALRTIYVVVLVKQMIISLVTMYE